jgi:imidazolonepropionase-like amidohydrolase
MRAVLLSALVIATATQAQNLVFQHATVYTITAGTIQDGAVRINNGQIIEVGRSDEVPATDAKVIDLTGKVLIPGLVDSHSHVGIVNRPRVAGADNNEGSGPIQPALRAIDAINPHDPAIRQALAGGVTTANIMPGSGNAMGGQTAYVKLRGRTVDEMLVNPGGISGGMKMANGENPKKFNQGQDKGPGTRMAIAALQRDVFVRAINYRNKRKAAEQDKKKEIPARDLGLEAVLEILDRKRVVHFHSHRADDIMTAIRLSDEFNFRLVLQHGTLSDQVVGEIASRGIPVSMTLVDSPGGKHEIMGLLSSAPALLEQAGLTVALNSDDWVTESRFLLRTAALAVRDGMSRDAALGALTINPARMLDLGERLGSIEPGKDADLVVLSGEPFSVYTQVLATYIDGEKVFDRSDPLDERYAVGGFALTAGYPVTETVR